MEEYGGSRVVSVMVGYGEVESGTKVPWRGMGVEGGKCHAVEGGRCHGGVWVEGGKCHGGKWGGGGWYSSTMVGYGGGGW